MMHLSPKTKSIGVRFNLKLHYVCIIAFVRVMPNKNESQFDIFNIFKLFIY